MINFTDFSLGVKEEDFENLDEKFSYYYVSTKGNILTGGNKRLAINFFEKVCNTMMKQGRNTGKKEKCYLQFTQIINQLSIKKEGQGVLVFLKAIFKSMPTRSVRRERRGSGKITRAVYLSPSKRIIFVLSNLTKDLSLKRKRNKSYVQCFVNEILLAYHNDNSSMLLQKRREAQASADSSNY